MKHNQTIINNVLVTMKTKEAELGFPLNTTLSLATELANAIRYRTLSDLRDVATNSGTENYSFVRLNSDIEAYFPATAGIVRIKPVMDFAGNCIFERIGGDSINLLKDMFEGYLDAKGIEFRRVGGGKKRSIEIPYDRSPESVQNVIAILDECSLAIEEFRNTHDEVLVA